MANRLCETTVGTCEQNTLLFAFVFISVAALPRALWDAAQPDVVPFFSYLFVAYVISDLIILGVLASQWLRSRPYQTLERHLNSVLFVFLVLNNLWPLVAYRAVASRKSYIAPHCIDGLVQPIIFCSFDLHPTANLFLLLTHGSMWAGVHSWLTDFDGQEFGSTTCYLLVCLVFCGTNVSGRLGTLRDSFDMNALKQEAEEGYRRFLSCMMHEMRNPIGGAMFLLDDLEHCNRRVLMTAGKARGNEKRGKGTGQGTGGGTNGSNSSRLSRKSLITAHGREGKEKGEGAQLRLPEPARASKKGTEERERDSGVHEGGNEMLLSLFPNEL
uniref:Uncharacterized protein n=1 Tax=Chromera velia CCMP2878 TaxID=1169474 RepID=A0A0G4GKC0_9ALVE|eukprot:Cvel_22295.t1-p1 / transcript=Cvel_22295.t1 / gene=Cvel_22295 / organism=Chromera_velia_CCMP2878 / gene_product=hypothetical protein / transcript_product=hypothetical protein / location=Cvel_scaffold2177:17751-19332(-) / protein_length=327 / sequence_SO=supercontig / SO=protein_coding / is_pseudo=false